MTITVDTHVILWDALNPKKLSKKAIEAIGNANRTNGIIFPTISLWEIAMLVEKERVTIDTSYREFIGLIRAANNYVFKEIDPEIAELSAKLPSKLALDPADRLICATSIVTKTPLITADKNLRKSGVVDTIW